MALWRRMGVVYALLLWAAFAFPASVVNGVEDHRLGFMLGLAHRLDALSTKSGVKGLSAGLRGRFRDLLNL